MRLVVAPLCAFTVLALGLMPLGAARAEEGLSQGPVELQEKEPEKPAAGASAPAAVELAADPNSTGGLSIFVMGVDGRGLRALHPMADFTGQGSPSWSRDGKTIAFDAWKADSDEGSHVYLVNVDGSELRDLGPGAMPCWSPVEDFLLVSQHMPDWGSFVVRFKEGDRVKMVHAFGATWSPDSMKLAAITPPGKGLALFELETGELTPLSPDILVGGSWSPDGSRFCGIRDAKGGTQELVIVSTDPADDRVTVRLKGRMNNQAKWSPDGKWILFSQQVKPVLSFQLYLVEPDGDAEPRLVPGQDPRRNNSDGNWSQDGSQIAFASQPNLKELPPSE